MKATDNTDVAVALRRSQESRYDNSWSMPPIAYTDAAVLELERDHLFAKEWICIGRVEELPVPGSRMTFQLCDEPLVAVRGADERIRVFSNVCRHRGAVIETGAGTGSRLVCPYHHWTYGLDGSLVAAPRLDEHADFDVAGCRLPEFATEEWLGFLFVSLLADPAPLAPQLAPLEALVANYHMEEMKVRFVANEVWNTNWKSFIENFMEGYHLSPTHRTTLHPVNPTRLCRHYPPGDAHFGYNAGFSPDLPRSVRGHPDLTDDEVGNCVMFAVPPGLVSGCAGDYSSFICVQPESVDRVRLKMGLLFFGPDWSDDAVDNAAKLFQETNAEDRAILVELTSALRSRHARSGPLAPADLEGSLVDFQHYLAAKLGPWLDD